MVVLLSSSGIQLWEVVMSNRNWALINADLVCQKDGKEMFKVENVEKVFEAFDTNTQLFAKLYFFKQCLQDYKAGESNATTMKERLEQLVKGEHVKVRRTFEGSKGGGFTLNAALKKAEEKKGSALSEEEVAKVTKAFNELNEMFG